MELDAALVRFCADCLNPHKLLDKAGNPAIRTMRLIGNDRRMRGAQILMVDEEGEPLTGEQLAQSVMERAEPLLAQGDDLTLELMKKGAQNRSDHMPIRPYIANGRGSAIARRPLDVLTTSIAGKEQTLIIADPTAQLASVLAAVVLQRDEQNNGILHRAMDSNDELRRDASHWQARAITAEHELRWYKRTEPVPANEIAEREEPAWTTLREAIAALKGPVAEIVGAGSAIARAAMGAGAVPPAAPREVPRADDGTDESAENGGSSTDIEIPPHEVPAAVDQLMDVLVPLLQIRPDLIVGLLPRLRPILDQLGEPALAVLRAMLASKPVAPTPVPA